MANNALQCCKTNSGSSISQNKESREVDKKVDWLRTQSPPSQGGFKNSCKKMYMYNLVSWAQLVHIRISFYGANQKHRKSNGTQLWIVNHSWYSISQNPEEQIAAGEQIS